MTASKRSRRCSPIDTDTARPGSWPSVKVQRLQSFSIAGRLPPNCWCSALPLDLGGARRPGEAVHVRNLRRQRGGDAASGSISVNERSRGVEEAFHLDTQRPAGPAGSGVRCCDTRHLDGDRFGGIDDLWVDAVEQPVSDVRRYLPADVADESGDDDARDRVSPSPARATPTRPSIAPADDSASSHECFASATIVAERIRRPTASL